jgi:hypothetical protein
MRAKTGMGSHQSSNMLKDEWLTPPDIMMRLPFFDLDPCAPIVRIWPTATNHYTIEDDGLKQEWNGKVFCNPPYGKETWKWLKKMSEHGNGIALVFARTETKMFFDHVWPHATAILFIKGRLHFHHSTGKRAEANAGAPSCLIAYGHESADQLEQSGIEGKFIRLL